MTAVDGDARLFLDRLAGARASDADAIAKITADQGPSAAGDVRNRVAEIDTVVFW